MGKNWEGEEDEHNREGRKIIVAQINLKMFNEL